jgi:hypothetical protein
MIRRNKKYTQVPSEKSLIGSSNLSAQNAMVQKKSWRNFMKDRKNMKTILFLLTFNLYAAAELPKIDYGDINNNIRCIQGNYSCACCEEHFGNCKKGSLEIFNGQCTDLDAPIHEIRNSIHYDEGDET